MRTVVHHSRSTIGGPKQLRMIDRELQLILRIRLATVVIRVASTPVAIGEARNTVFGVQPSASWSCRWCGSRSGTILLDLGDQPAAAGLPLVTDPLPDACGPLRMVGCLDCGLCQLEAGIPSIEELPAVEPRVMIDQARQAVGDLADAGHLGRGSAVREFPSPHGSGWEQELTAAGAHVLHDEHAPASVVVDVWGMMHEPDQRAALHQRVGLLSPEGRLVLQIHPIEADMDHRAWHTLRHGHYAYYSAAAIIRMVGSLGLGLIDVLRYPLQGSTMLLVFGRNRPPEPAARALIADTRTQRPGSDFEVIAGLDQEVQRTGTALRDYLADCRKLSLRVVAYPASSSVPALLGVAGVGADDVMLVGDASPAKQGRALPVNRIPIESPQTLAASRPDRVLLFVPGLLDELRGAMPEIEASGGRWVVADPYPQEV